MPERNSELTCYIVDTWYKSYVIMRQIVVAEH